VPRRDPHQPGLFPEPDPRVEPVDPGPGTAALAARLDPRLHLGTSSWTFPGWKGLVYAGTPTQTDLVETGLRAYAQHPLFRTVGLDRAFYRPVPESIYTQLAAQTPPGFRFLVKAYAGLTRPETDEPTPKPNPTFLDPEYARRFVIEPATLGLADRCGPILFQFSPMDLRPLGGPAAFIARLHTFLRALPRGPLYAVELRNPQLLTPDYAAALADTGVAHGLNLHPTMPTPAQQAAVLGERIFAPALVCRWLLHLGHSYEGAKDRYAPFDRLVDPDPATRSSLADLCRQALTQGKAAYVIANNKAEGSAPRSLIELARAIAG
jgi:uncharacterized protein YecE (DUF72 family)